MPFVITPSDGDTFGDLKDDFFARGFQWMEDGGDEEARAERFINQAVNELCAMADWSFLQDSDTGTSPLTLSDVRKVVSVVDSTTGTELAGLERAYLVDQFSTDLTLTGSPAYWYLDGNDLTVYPVSSSDTITVRYVANPSELAGDSDVCVVPKRWSNIVVDLAVLRGLRSQDNIEEDSGLRAEIDRQVQDMMAADLMRGESTFVRLSYSGDS